MSLDRLDVPLDTEHNKVAVIGRTGAGKSTLLNLLSALRWPSRGQVRWVFPDGEDMAWGPAGRSLLPEQIMRLRQCYFGFMFQDSTLTPHLSVLENLAYPLEIRGERTGAARRRAAEAFSKVLVRDINGAPIDDARKLLRSYPHQLAAGQRQRVALVQALIHDPCVLFADEPTANLDSETANEVMSVLDVWLKDEPSRRALVWVTHHPPLVAQPGDRRLRVASKLCHLQEWAAQAWQDSPICSPPG